MVEEYFTEEEIAIICGASIKYKNLIKLIMANRKRIVDLEKRLNEVKNEDTTNKRGIKPTIIQKR